MLNFFHNFIPHPVLLQLGGLQIHWYGLLMVIAMVAGLFVVLKLSSQFGVAKAAVWDLSFGVIISALIGARLYHVALEYGYYAQNPLAIFKIWEGGIALHGAWLGGLLALYYYAHKHKLKLSRLLDLLVFGLVLGQVIGRLGNYFNQELFGLPTSLPWGVPIDLANRPAGFSLYEYFHPTFLYEMIGNLVIFDVLFLVKQYKKFDGQIFLSYLALYSLLRFVTEFVRIDPTLMVLGLRWPQVLSGALFLLSVGGLVYILLKKRSPAVN